jgi:hypothetical protein
MILPQQRNFGTPKIVPYLRRKRKARLSGEAGPSYLRMRKEGGQHSAVGLAHHVRFTPKSRQAGKHLGKSVPKADICTAANHAFTR